MVSSTGLSLKSWSHLDVRGLLRSRRHGETMLPKMQMQSTTTVNPLHLFAQGGRHQQENGILLEIWGQLMRQSSNRVVNNSRCFLVRPTLREVSTSAMRLDYLLSVMHKSLRLKGWLSNQLPINTYKTLTMVSVHFFKTSSQIEETKSWFI